MKLALCLILSAALVSCQSVRQPADWTYQVVRVIDGDTIVVADPCGVQTHVRFAHVNAPELGTPDGDDARSRLEKLLGGRHVRLHPYARDVYGRTIADVTPAE